MGISYNTGTTSTVNNSGTAGGHTFTIPAGVLTGDIVYVLVGCFTTATGSLTVTLTSSATAPTTVGAQQNTGINAGIQVSSQVFQIKATGSDAGATLTYGATGGSGGSYWYNVGLVSYSGPSSTNPDVNAGNQSFSGSSTGTGTVTTPSATTGVSGDWQIQLLMVAPPNGANFTTPGGLTSRQSLNNTANAGILLAIADSNASVGGSGTAIGNTAWSYTGGGSGNIWITTFTVGMEPPASGVSGTVQPRATVKVPRLRPARALWRGAAGPLFPPAVPAPLQLRPVPRRKPARAVVRFTPVTTTNAVAFAIPVTLTGGVLPYAGGVILQEYTQVFTTSGTWTAPNNLAGAPAVWAQGPSGTAASGTAGTGAGGAGAGAIGGETALGGVAAGTVLTVTIGAAGSGNPTTITGGAVTVQGNPGGNASVGTGGAAGPASANTVTFAGGAGGNGAAGGSGGGGGGGGSAGQGGAGGPGGAGVGTAGGAAGTAGPGNPAGAPGGVGGTASAGAAGTAPGGGPGGGSGGTIHGPGAATAGQATITWQVLTPVLMAFQRRRPARAYVRSGAGTVAPVTAPAGTIQPRPTVPVPRRRPARAWFRGGAGTVAIPGTVQPRPALPAPRRRLARAYVQFTPVTTTNATPAAPAIPRQQPAPAPRRRPARAYVRFTPVTTANQVPPAAGAGRPLTADSDRPWLKRRRAKWYRHGPALESFYGAEIPAGVGSAYLAGGGLAADPGADDPAAAVAAAVAVGAEIPDAGAEPDRRVRSRPNLGERLRGSNRPGRPVWSRNTVVPAAGDPFDIERSERLVNSYRLPRPGWRSTREYPLPVVQRRK